ncbi:CIC11C00000001363 [Sungouiella intermedia]|uniref:CIC11C00000001363 n=1 Tax=Sungouiella intermedia TaxID=45354 RepID=A0A1L0D3X7_9ASCO|nr:CIC11C00000001363 [[Candida] intermedia]
MYLATVYNSPTKLVLGRHKTYACVSNGGHCVYILWHKPPKFVVVHGKSVLQMVIAELQVAGYNYALRW